MRYAFLALLLAGCATYPVYEPAPGSLPVAPELAEHCRDVGQMAFLQMWTQLNRSGFAAGRAKKLAYRMCMRQG